MHLYAPFLTTQKEIDFYSGLGEVVKLHILGGAESADRLDRATETVRSREVGALHTAVRDSLLIKKGYIEGDEFDTAPEPAELRPLFRPRHRDRHGLRCAARTGGGSA